MTNSEDLVSWWVYQLLGPTLLLHAAEDELKLNLHYLWLTPHSM